jgi:hypothetical protein
MIENQRDERRSFNMEDQLMTGPNDVELAQDVYGILKDKEGDVHVMVKNGIIHLAGDVDDPSVKKELVAIAKNLPNVRYVIDHLRVLPKVQIRFPWNETDPKAIEFRSLLHR